jgi:hypothetical protein
MVLPEDPNRCVLKIISLRESAKTKALKHDKSNPIQS